MKNLTFSAMVLLAFVACGCSQTPPTMTAEAVPQDEAPQSPKIRPEDKIDAPLMSIIETGDKAISVVLLGKTQMLDGAKAFGAFCKANATKMRSDLRTSVLKKLKADAVKEQKQILQAMDSPSEARALWMVNVICIELTPEQIRKAAALDAVKYIYLEHKQKIPASTPGKIEVIKPVRRKPFSTKGKKISWDVEMIGAARTWKELGVTGESVIVAMLDLGVHYKHEDLRNNMWINVGEIPNNGKDDDANGYIDDYYGYNFAQSSPNILPPRRLRHGTWTSGIVAGDGTGGTITGMAPRARVMVLKAGGFYRNALAFQYALDHGADVINMSFTVPNMGNRRALWRMMCENATAAGLVCVSGAGNAQQRAPIPVQLAVPEGIPCVIAAGGVDRQMKVPNFSSLGPVEWGSVKFYEDYPMPKGLIKPDICGFPGPGYPVLDVADKGYFGPSKGIKGNSFSSPHIAGVAALILSANLELPAWRVKEIMEATAKDIGAPGKDNRSGAGLADAYEAVKMTKKEER